MKKLLPTLFIAFFSIWVVAQHPADTLIKGSWVIYGATVDSEIVINTITYSTMTFYSNSIYQRISCDSTGKQLFQHAPTGAKWKLINRGKTIKFTKIHDLTSRNYQSEHPHKTKSAIIMINDSLLTLADYKNLNFYYHYKKLAPIPMAMDRYLHPAVKNQVGTSPNSYQNYFMGNTIHTKSRSTKKTTKNIR